MMNPTEAIDEAVNVLMDYYLRPHLQIEDHNTDLDDAVYNYLHKNVRALVEEAARLK